MSVHEQATTMRWAGYCCLFVALALGACVKRNSEKDRSGSGPLSEVPVGRSGPLYKLVDPEVVKVTVSTTELAVKDYAGRFKLPTFSIQKASNNYVKILRCQASYREYLDYMMQQVAQKEANTRTDRQWIWVDSFGNPKFCKVASNHFAAIEFQDLGAKVGSFFYVVNPCVSAEISTTGQDECSHHLALTNTIDYNDSPSGAFLAKSAELADAESEYDAILTRLLGLSQGIMNQQELCEYNRAHTESKRNVDSAAWDLLSTAIAVTGGLGARALISQRAMHGMADKLTDLSSKVSGTMQRAATNSSSLFKTIGNANSFNKSLYTAGIFAGALAVSIGIRALTSERGSGAANPACSQADGLAAEILKIGEDKLLEKGREKMILISRDLSSIDASFHGYTEASFSVPSTQPVPPDAQAAPAPAPSPAADPDPTQ